MDHEALSKADQDALVVEHMGWAQSIARSVARSWSLDWQHDGLDGAAMEALMFCAGRFNPERGVPFRGYARRRIHEASTEAARQSKGWRGGTGNTSTRAREIAVDLLEVFPELRSGEIASRGGDMRSGIRQLLAGATVLAAHHGAKASAPDEILDIKQTIQILAALEPVHQLLLWHVYWEGDSMRSVAEEWHTDELTVIREHQSLLEHLYKSIANGKPGSPLRIRPSLKEYALKTRKQDPQGVFKRLLHEGEDDG